MKTTNFFGTRLVVGVHTSFVKVKGMHARWWGGNQSPRQFGSFSLRQNGKTEKHIRVVYDDHHVIIRGRVWYYMLCCAKVTESVSRCAYTKKSPWVIYRDALHFTSLLKKIFAWQSVVSTKALFCTWLLGPMANFFSLWIFFWADWHVCKLQENTKLVTCFYIKWHWLGLFNITKCSDKWFLQVFFAKNILAKQAVTNEWLLL